MILFGNKFGKKTNRKAWVEPCPHCKQNSELYSYEANKYFHLYYIPIIPLGRKKILWNCDICGHFQEMKFTDWEALQKEEIKKAKANFEQSDRSFESTLELRDKIYLYGSKSELKQIDELLETEFPDKQDHLSYHTGAEVPEKTTEGAADLGKKLQSSPDNENLKYQLGWAHFKEKDYQNAYKVLSTTNPFRSREDFSNMFELARQLKGRERYGVLMLLNDYFPDITRSHDRFQRLVKHTEKELNISAENSIQSSTYERNKKIRIAVVATVVGLILAGATIFYFVSSNSQKLFVLNGLQNDFSIQIDGENQQVVDALTFTMIEVSDGNHMARVNYGNVEKEIEFKIDNEVTDIFFNNPVFVLNPFGAAVYANEEVVYTTTNLYNLDLSYGLDTYTGEEFRRFEDVDYPFEYPPEEIQMDESRDFESRWWLSMYGFEPELNALILMDEEFSGDHERVLDFMETQMRYGYRTEEFLNIYDSLTQTYEIPQRALDFYKEEGIQ